MSLRDHHLAAELRNTLEIWFDNMLNKPDAWAELALVSCGPFDRLYSAYGVSVTTLVQDGQLYVAVGAEGAAETVWSGPFNIDADFEPAASAAVDEVCKLIDEDALNALYFA